MQNFSVKTVELKFRKMPVYANTADVFFLPSGVLNAEPLALHQCSTKDVRNADML